MKGCGEMDRPDPVTLIREYAKSHKQHFNMAGFRAPKLDTVAMAGAAYP